MADMSVPPEQVPRFPAVLALVDDDPAVRHALSFAFETAGIAVSAFSNAEAALASPDRRYWRCLVLDQRLPGMSGLDLFDTLKRAGFTAPAVLITTNPSREIQRRASEAGVEILEKPLLDDQLAQRVRRLMVT